MQRLLTSQELDRYFARVAYRGPRDASLVTLRALHRAHLLAVPYENLDIHIGRPLTLDPDAMFAKLVDERRGGWCYEMNGVFGHVLESLGFEVRYLSGAVGRATSGWRAQGNHLVLLVTLDRPWIADVGFGDGFLAPLPLEPGTYSQGFLRYRVGRDGPWWRVHNHEFGGADGFDFTLTPRALGDFAAQCRELQTSPESSFVKTTVCERFVPAGLVMLRGAVLRQVTAAGVTTDVLRDAEEYERALRECFGLAVPGIEGLWPRVWARHLEWEAAQAAAAPGASR
ncbi:MAG: arylamine N-acetyltransferase [Acidobacteria bacterium]|nr:arylamine N-acetyltransferase [Acidobacteriota bacterium]